MAAANWTLVVEKGATCNLALTVTQTVNGVTSAVNLTGYSAFVQARQQFSSATPFIDASTTNGMITFPNASLGKILLKVPPSVTSIITVTEGVWDFKIVPPGTNVDDATYLLAGKVRIREGATR